VERCNERRSSRFKKFYNLKKEVLFMIRTVLSFFLLILSILVSFSAFAATVDISFWNPFTGPDGVVIEKMVNDFNSTTGKEKGVKVNLLIVPWAEYYTKLTVAISSGTAPNLAIAHSHRIPGFVKEGALLEFNTAYLASIGLKKQDFVPALWKAGEIGGRRYGIPIDAFPRHLYYDRNLFKQKGLNPEKPPQTLDELIETATKLTDPQKGIWGLWFSLSGAWVARDFYSYFWQFEPNLLAPNKREVSSNFTEVAKKVFQIQTDFIRKYKVTPSEPTSYGALFGQGKLGIAVSQITELLMLEQMEGLDFSAAPMPLFGKQRATFALGHNFILPKGKGQTPEKIRAVNAFIEWFLRNSLEWVKGGKIPASLTLMKDKRFSELRIQSIVASQVDYMKLPPLIPEAPGIDDIIIRNGEAIYSGKSSIDEAVNRMASEIKELLSKGK